MEVVADIERHPAFGVARFNKVHGTGASLFDSEIKHDHYVIFEIDQASRKRDNNRDWIHPQETVVQIAMSEAQFGALVSSFGSGAGVPVTITRIGVESIEGPPYEPRMKQSVKEVEGAAEKLVAQIEDAREAVQEAFDRGAGKKEMKQLLFHLECMVGNAKANARYAANTFTEHVKNVVTKARYDIEAAVQMAAERGLSAGSSVAGILGTGDEMEG